jgi:hypothetical protein
MTGENMKSNLIFEDFLAHHVVIDHQSSLRTVNADWRPEGLTPSQDLIYSPPYNDSGGEQYPTSIE